MVGSILRVSHRALLGVVLALMASVASADAAPSREIRARAQRYVADGITAQSAGRFDEAISLYKLAYKLIPHPELLFNLGQAHRMKGERVTALRYYREYLVAEAQGRASREASEWIAALEQELQAEAARLAEEERAVEAARQAQAARDAEVARIAVQQAEARRAAAAAASSPSPQPENSPSGLTVRRKLALGGAGLAVATLGTALAFELSGMSSHDDYLEKPWGDAGKKRYHTANDKHLAAQYLAIAGVACAGAAAYLWISGKRSRSSTSEARLVPLVDADSAGLFVAGGF
jgi:tetratricopeptide (TPR) repeat protein